MKNKKLSKAEQKELAEELKKNLTDWAKHRETDEYKRFVEIRDRREELIPKLLPSIKEHMPEIDALLDKLKQFEEDGVYRFYHSSFKVFFLQTLIKSAIELFTKIAPENIPLNKEFESIVKSALSEEFEFGKAHSKNFDTRFILEAFWHCKYFLEQMSVYGKELEECPTFMSSGWNLKRQAAVGTISVGKKQRNG